MRVVVYHGGYGCDTGCCGHWVEIDGENAGFEFGHPGYQEDFRDYAMDLAREKVEEKFGKGHTFDLDWDECVIIDD